MALPSQRWRKVLLTCLVSFSVFGKYADLSTSLSLIGVLELPRYAAITEDASKMLSVIFMA
jgi:hypothetical protein